ncbi:SPOCS domain-containing protein [Phosphitispora sp. TUW77]|uniref:SPOCS domain-containing protein n=1 Tax=Phosphitispora sp. TUW77 TaxID=3152361 RepID=UPI003AB42446
MKKTFFFCPNPKKNIGFGYCPRPHDHVSYYSQVVLNGHCEIPEPKPDCETLIDKYHSIEILKSETIDAIQYLDCHRVQGKKVVITGNFKLGIEYSANEPSQKVHYFECIIPFSAFILPCIDNQEFLFPQDFVLDEYVVHVCMEDLQLDRISDRLFNKVIVLMIWLQQKNDIPEGGKDCEFY